MSSWTRRHILLQNLCFSSRLRVILNSPSHCSQTLLIVISFLRWLVRFEHAKTLVDLSLTVN